MSSNNSNRSNNNDDGGFKACIPRSQRRAVALLVVDMSVEQCENLSVRRKQLIIQTIQRLLKLEDKFITIIDSRLWLHNNTESTLSRVYPEWGTTMGIPNSIGAALIPELKDKYSNWNFIAKKHYSSFVDSTLMEKLNLDCVEDVYIVGINTDYCIFNTAIDCFARGRFNTYVIEEGFGSISGSNGHEQGLQWIRAHLGPNAVISIDDVIKKVSSYQDSLTFKP